MCDINFQSSHSKRHASKDIASEQGKRIRSSGITPPSESDMSIFFKKISEAKAKPAILKITLPYAHNFIPILSNPKFPAPLTELYNTDMLNSSYLDLIWECEKVFESLKVFDHE